MSGGMSALMLALAVMTSACVGGVYLHLHALNQERYTAEVAECIAELDNPSIQEMCIAVVDTRF